MTRNAGPAAGRRSLRARLLLAGGTALLLLGILEIALRWTAPARKSFVPAGIATYEGHPFAQYALRSASDGINAHGFRGAPIPTDKRTGELRIACLGGSSTFCTRVPLAAAYPSQLAELLGDPVRVVNAGVPGYTSANVLALLQFRILPLQPDILVVYSGFNDCGAAVGARPADTGFDGALTAFRSPGMVQSLMARSALLRFVNSAFDEGFLVTHLHHLTRSHPNSAFHRVDPVRVVRMQHHFVANIRSALAIAADRGIRVLLVGQVVREVPALAPWVVTAVAANNAGLARLARERAKVAYLDLPATLPADPSHLVDAIHMTAAGNAARAQRIAAKLRELGWCE